MISVISLYAGVVKLLRSLPSIALAAKHLAVLNDCSAVVAPRCDVVALHELEVELLAADGAAVPLLLPYGKFDVLGEGTQVEIVLVACQNASSVRISPRTDGKGTKFT